MPTKTKPTNTTAVEAVSKPPTKSALILKLLTRAKGATIDEMAEPTGWQPHSTRAHLSSLRKKGRSIVREQRKTGESAYRIVDARRTADDPPRIRGGSAAALGSDTRASSGVGAEAAGVHAEPAADAAPATEIAA